jgi:long-chain acyl-CoA synthetase
MDVSKINSLIELYFKKAEQIDKKKPFLKWLNPKNNHQYNWEEVTEKIYKFSYKIKSLIKEGDRVLLLSENRPEWLIADLAIMNAGGITVPIFTTYAERDYEYILKDCSPSLIVVSNDAQFEKINKFIDNKEIISFEKIKTPSITFESIFDEKYEKEINDKLNRKLPACIIYTSGTSGNPKGVILSHGGILSNCEGALELLQPLLKKKEPIFLTWLPLSHSYEHTVQMIQILIGAKVFYAENLEKLISNMGIAKPTIMTAVPRFYQNLFTKINMNFEKQKGLKKGLINKTLILGKKMLNKNEMTFFEKIQNFICQLLVRKKIRNQFGGNLQAFISGGGALDQNVGEFLNAIGLPTLQGYGLTETSPVVSCNLPNLVKVDTVGPPFRTNEVRIASDGEILIRGENVMLGYWNQQEATKEVLKDGWLHTGDIGEIDQNGFLKITDRKKDIIVNLGGDNIAPSKIENILCLNELIKQSFVYGDKKNYLVAIIVAAKEVNKEKIKLVLENINKNLTQVEKVKKFVLIYEEFTINNGMLTPTLKLKRKEIIKNYKQQLENLY